MSLSRRLDQARAAFARREYEASAGAPIPSALVFPISVSLSGLALFGLGAAKVLVTGLRPLRSGLEMLLVGSLAAGAAYLVGAVLKGIVG